MESYVDLKSMYVDLVENLNCPICHEILKEARDLACGHSYCLGCVQELVAINGWKSNIKCCLCQKMTNIPSAGLEGLKQNYKLNCILEEQAAIMKKMEASLDEPSQQQGDTGPTQIFVRDLKGKTRTFDVRLSDTADALKRQVEKKLGIPPNEQRMIWGGKLLNGSTTLEDIGIGNLSTIELTIPLQGGNMTH